MSGGFFNPPQINKPLGSVPEMFGFNSHYWRTPAVESPVPAYHGHHQVFAPLNNAWALPPPPPPIFPKRNRHGYLDRHPRKSGLNNFDMVVRPMTEPSKMNEEQWDELFTRVSDALTNPMRDELLQLKCVNDEKKKLMNMSGEKQWQQLESEPLPKDWNPHQSAKGKFPRKGEATAKRAANNVDTFVNWRETNESGAITILKNSRKIVRRPPGASTVEHGKIVKVQKQLSGKSQRDEVDGEIGPTENAVRGGPTEPVSNSGMREGEVEVIVEEVGNPSSNDCLSPPDSPARVVVFRGGEMVCETASKSPRSPFRAAQSPPVRVTNVVKPSYASRGRGSMSLRVINGHRVTGDSRECFANLNGNCQSGPFCRFEHSGSRSHAEGKVCTRLLRGLCRPNNGDCVAPHSLLPHQYPICSFFLRTNCHETDCQLLHVRYTPQMPRCDEFVRGVCTKGDACDLPHTYPFELIKLKGSRESATSPRDAVPPSKSPSSSLLTWIE